MGATNASGGRISGRDSYTSRIALFAMAGISLCVEIMQGFATGGDVTKAGTNLVSGFFVCMLLIAACVSPSYQKNLFGRQNFLLVISVILLLAWYLSIGFAVGAVRYDVFALLRSVVLGYFVYKFCASVDFESRELLLVRTALFVWLFISLTIMIGAVAGVGLYTYPEYATGYRFYYPSLNELTFVYFSSYLVLAIGASRVASLLFFSVMTLAVFLIIGNKSFVVLFLVSACSYFLICARLPARIFVIGGAGLILLWVVGGNYSVAIFDTLIDYGISFLVQFSNGSSKLLEKLSYLNPMSALISERDMLFMLALELYEIHYGVFETLFGIGYSSYGLLYGAIRGENGFSYAEIDPVDIFMSYGVVGLFVVGLILYKVYSRGYEPSHRLYLLRRILVILFVINGALTGHIYLMGFPVFFFAYYAGLCRFNEQQKVVSA